VQDRALVRSIQNGRASVETWASEHNLRERTLASGVGLNAPMSSNSRPFRPGSSGCVNLGNDDAWECAFFRYSDEKYELSLGASGSFEATPEEAFDCSARIYLTT